jgi:hypothetical protein
VPLRPQLFYAAHEQGDGEVESAMEAAQTRQKKTPALMTVQGMAHLERELLGAHVPTPPLSPLSPLSHLEATSQLPVAPVVSRCKCGVARQKASVPPRNPSYDRKRFGLPACVTAARRTLDVLPPADGVYAQEDLRQHAKDQQVRVALPSPSGRSY